MGQAPVGRRPAHVARISPCDRHCRGRKNSARETLMPRAGIVPDQRANAEQDSRIQYLCEFPFAELRHGIAALDGDARRSATALVVLLVLLDLPTEQRNAILSIIRT